MRFQGDRVKDNNEYRFKDFPSVCYNIDDLETCYTKRLDQDALKIIDIIADANIFPNIKNRGIMLAGPSQGGNNEEAQKKLIDTLIQTYNCLSK